VLLTEASIAGGNSRGMPASSLKEVWVAAARDRGVDYTDAGMVSGLETPECIGDLAAAASSGPGKPMLVGCQDLPPFECGLIKVACELLESRGRAAPGLVCVTGSLHLAASVLQQLGQR
jgi:dihydrofolate synthase